MNRGGGSSGQASIPMNLFATWEIDRSSANCIPRICSMSICRLSVIRELDKDVQSVFIAVKMQGSKRVFRSNEIYLTSGGLTDTTLELTFSLQYPHFVKRNENRLQLMLQRKKRYKNRAMLGYKTLAVGRVDMAQIIQCPIVEESTIDLYAAAGKDHDVLIIAAQINVLNMTSIPIDADMESERGRKVVGSENFSEEDEDEENDETYSSEQDIASDNPQEFADEESRNNKRKNRRKVRMSSSSRQQNFIKTKVAALLKKFKQVADEGLEPGLEPDMAHHPTDPVDYDFLYDEIEDFNLSDSCPEMDDNCSIVSTPKPKLRPFFDRLSHSSSQTEISSLREQNNSEQVLYQPGLLESQEFLETEEEEPPTCDQVTLTTWADQELIEQKQRNNHANHTHLCEVTGARASTSAPNSPKSRRVSKEGPVGANWARSASFREGNNCTPGTTEPSLLSSCFGSLTFLEKLSSLEDTLPGSVCLLDGSHRHSCPLASMMTSLAPSLALTVAALSVHDVRSVFAGIIGLLQKYINSNSQSPEPVKLMIFGAEAFLNTVLRQYVEHLSARPPEWQSFFVFYLLPLGSNRVSRYIASIDSRYSSLFVESSWKDNIEKVAEAAPVEPGKSPSQDAASVLSRIKEYLKDANGSLPFSVAEAMITFRQTSGDEDNTQTFLPFISDVKVGENELVSTESDKEDFTPSTTLQGVSQAPNAPLNPISPPASPSVTIAVPLTNAASQGVTSSGSSGASGSTEAKLGLQVDYWKERDAGKYSLKNNFKSFHVHRLPALGERATSGGLALDVVTKGKKMIMRLPGKKGKEKESESKSHVVGNVSRLLCTSKHQHSLLKVKIDGVEWRGIKFFQLSSHWSSHVKLFPVAVFLHNAT